MEYDRNIEFVHLNNMYSLNFAIQQYDLSSLVKDWESLMVMVMVMMMKVMVVVV